MSKVGTMSRSCLGEDNQLGTLAWHFDLSLLVRRAVALLAFLGNSSCRENMILSRRVLDSPTWVEYFIVTIVMNQWVFTGFYVYENVG